jgi:hypothetical protein
LNIEKVNNAGEGRKTVPVMRAAVGIATVAVGVGRLFSWGEYLNHG